VRGRTLTAATVLALGIAGGCGGKTGAAPDAAGVMDAGADTGGGSDAHPGGDAAPSCVPTLPALPWTSPYAGWSRGVPTDPDFFPIGVWLQGSWHATEISNLGVNLYIGNNAGTDTLAASDLATLKSHGIYAIVGQDSVGLANIDDPTIVGWWMTPDEPDNAQDDGMGGYGPPVAPATLVSRYNAYKAADPTRPVYLGLGQGVAFDAWEGRGSNAPPESQYVAAGDILAFDIYPVQQLRRRREREDDVRSVLAERARRRSPAPERFIQTLLREWAYAAPYSTSAHRGRVLPRWLRYYNERRPHGSLDDVPPIARIRSGPLNNVLRNHN
jgi:hypothetical protein